MIDLRAILLAGLVDFVTRYRACGMMTGDATEREANRLLDDLIRPRQH